MLAIASGTLTPTATYASRSWCWLSTGAGEAVIEHTGEVVPCMGVLTIKMQARERYARRNGTWGVPRACEIDSYALEEVDPEFPGTRAFLLLSLTDPGQREPYLVHVGGVDTCRCKAGTCRVESGCKHTASLEALVAEGLLDTDAARLAVA